MRQLYTDDDVALLQARIEAMQFVLDEIRLKMEDEPFVDQPVPQTGGVWNGEIRVAGKIVTSDFEDSWDGDPSGYVRVWFDGTTVPSYATAIQYAANDWGDDNKIVQLREIYASYGAYNVDRA